MTGELALGLMSGTSGDGVSASLVSFRNRSFRLLAYQTFPYPDSIREKISRGLQLRTPEISELDQRLGELFAEAALKILKRARVSGRKVSVIGSHGQTIYHGPRDSVPSTFQIGEAAIITERTGIPVVSDFRPQDIALGGEGAPLIPYFDWYFYGRGPVRALQNIGGIANVTMVGKELKRPLAFDTGPGNCLINLAVRKITRGKRSYDSGGRWARRGHVLVPRIEAMLRHPHFKRRPPKSTGPEEFGEGFLRRYLGKTLSRNPSDALATLTFFTAATIYRGIGRFSPIPPQEIVISGGGVKNLTLMHQLRQLFSPVPVRSIEEWGIPVQAKEPIAFAFFALRTLRGQINHLPSVTGASRATILGKLTQPSPSRLKRPPIASRDRSPDGQGVG